MFCPNCGAKNDDGTRFCYHCGTALNGAETAAPSVGFSVPPAAAAAPVAMNRAGAVLATLQRLATSPLYLTAVIAYTCYVAFALINGFTASNRIVSAARDLMRLSGTYDSSFDFLFSFFGSSISWTTVIALLPPIAITVGLWLIFAAARDKMAASLNPVGLTVIRVVTIIQMVCSALLAVACVLGLLFAAFAVLDNSASAFGVLLLVTLVTAALFGLLLFYQWKVIGMLGQARITFSTLEPNVSVSRFVAVLCFIGGGFTAILALFNILSGFFAFLSSAANATAAICFGILILTYQKQMTAILAGDLSAAAPPAPAYQPVYSAPSAPPQPYAAPSAPSFGETSVLGGSAPSFGETTVLQSSAAPKARLTRLKTNAVTVITGSLLRIGKDPALVDLAFADNPSVSRHHADIVERGGAFYVIDQSSTNHVYINGQIIVPGVETPLDSGVELRLGDEAFRFETL